MKRLLLVAMCTALARLSDAQTLGGIVEVTVVDRDSGATLVPYRYRGEYWVAGRPGARYAIEIHNRAGERVLAVTSVDGVNVVSGATAGWDQGGYVLSPGERYQITGWRKSDAEIAAFTFTDSPNSYAERTGRPANVGVIGVAVFRERVPEVALAPRPVERPSAEPAPRAGESGGAPARSADALGEAAPPYTPPYALPSAAASSRAQAAQVAPRTPAPSPKLGTGHGEREVSYVVHTDFIRMQSAPNEVIRIRYDSLENLIAMGIVRRPRLPPPGANPFPESPGPQYVPDPPG